jgi:4-oxalomesaconate tautomerase
MSSHHVAAGRDGIRATLMRGGTSKGAYFLAPDLPADAAERDDLLLRVMGSPDPRQIDGVGGAHPLTSKVAVISPSATPGVDVDYLFLQVMVDEPVVTDKQNCGNILAGVGPFAVERGLVRGQDGETSVRIRMVNTGDLVTATFPTPGGRPSYRGDTAIDGVPGTAAPVVLAFGAPAGGSDDSPDDDGPAGNVADEFGGVPVTCVDNGMPVVVVAARSLGKTGYESVAELEGDAELGARVRRGAVSVGTAVMLPGAVGSDLAAVASRTASGPGTARLAIEHPGGAVCVEVGVDATVTPPKIFRAGVVRTARKLFDGVVFPR